MLAHVPREVKYLQTEQRQGARLEHEFIINTQHALIPTIEPWGLAKGGLQDLSQRC